MKRGVKPLVVEGTSGTTPDRTSSARYIGESIRVAFARRPMFEKKPDCPQSFDWRGKTYTVRDMLREWKDYARRGRMARNMRPDHAATASRRGSWGVGRHYFRVRVTTGQVFEIYYDRAPGGGNERKGSWFLYRETADSETT
jgi:hypothetical protein